MYFSKIIFRNNVSGGPKSKFKGLIFGLGAFGKYNDRLGLIEFN